MYSHCLGVVLVDTFPLEANIVIIFILPRQETRPSDNLLFPVEIPAVYL